MVVYTLAPVGLYASGNGCCGDKAFGVWSGIKITSAHQLFPLKVINRKIRDL